MKINKELLEIRNPKISDIKQATVYVNRLSKEKTYVTFQGEIISEKDERKWLKKIIKGIEENKNVVKFIFYKNDLIGICDVSSRSGIHSHIAGFGLSIDKKYRGCGLGSLLTDKVLEESKLRLKNIKYINLTVFSDNEGAVHLYNKKGFVEYGRFKNGLKRRGRFSDEIFMVKENK